MSSKLDEFTGYHLTVDCCAAGCRGERQLAISDLAAVSKDRTVSQAMRAMRCSACGGRVMAAWLETGPLLNARVRPRRVALMGPEAR